MWTKIQKYKKSKNKIGNKDKSRKKFTKTIDEERKQKNIK